MIIHHSYCEEVIIILFGMYRQAFVMPKATIRHEKKLIPYEMCEVTARVASISHFVLELKCKNVKHLSFFIWAGF